MIDFKDIEIISTGKNPRDIPEFSDIRAEINKLNHPAHPPIDWALIESLAVKLFQKNGVDLQTVSYYTFARTQLSGLTGFTEGCELMSSMVEHQWESFWPQSLHARSEMFEWFNARVGSKLRSHDLSSSDIEMIRRAEAALKIVTDKLQGASLKKVPRVGDLLNFIQTSADEIEKTHKEEDAPLPVPELVYIPDVKETEKASLAESHVLSESPNVKTLVKKEDIKPEPIPAQTEAQENSPPKQEEAAQPKKPVVKKLAAPPKPSSASVSDKKTPDPVPLPVSAEKISKNDIQQEKLVPPVEAVITPVNKKKTPEPRIDTPSPSLAEEIRPAKGGNSSFFWYGGIAGIALSALIAFMLFQWKVTPLIQQRDQLEADYHRSIPGWLKEPQLDSYKEQLTKLANRSPLNNLQTGDAIASIASQRWPDSPEQIQATKEWKQLVQARVGDNIVADNYFQTTNQVRQLMQNLLQAEESKKGVTISSLKTAVYEILHTLSGDMPLEELLRQLSEQLNNDQTPSPALLKQIDERFNTLLGRYYLLQQRIDN